MLLCRGLTGGTEVDRATEQTLFVYCLLLQMSPPAAAAYAPSRKQSHTGAAHEPRPIHLITASLVNVSKRPVIMQRHYFKWIGLVVLQSCTAWSQCR